MSYLASKTQKLFVLLLFNFDYNYVALDFRCRDFGLIHETQADKITKKY